MMKYRSTRTSKKNAKPSTSMLKHSRYVTVNATYTSRNAWMPSQAFVNFERGCRTFQGVSGSANMLDATSLFSLSLRLIIFQLKNALLIVGRLIFAKNCRF